MIGKNEPAGVCLVYVTLPITENGQMLAERLVAEGYCAGINIIGPGHSVYHWQGRVHRAEEWIMFAQVAQDKLQDFESALLELHPHVVPCILSLGVQSGFQSFIDWIKNPQTEVQS